MTDKCQGINCERFVRKGEELCDRCWCVFRANISKRDCPGEIYASLKVPSTWKFPEEDEEVLEYLLGKVMDRAMTMAKQKGVAEKDMPKRFVGIYETVSARELVYGP